MATNYSVHTKIRAQDNASPVMKRIADQARRTARGFTTLNTAAAGLRNVGKLARPLERGISFAATAAVGAGGAALLMANNYATARDEQAKFSRQIGFSADAMDRLSFIIDRQGGSFDALKSGLGAFTKRMGELRAETGGLYANLKKTDPAFAEMLKNTTDNEQAFELFLGKVAGLPDEQAKAALAAAGVSRGSMAEIIRLTDGGTEAFAALKEEADKFRAPVSSEDLIRAEQYKDAQTNLIFALRGVSDTISSRILPVMTPFVERMAEWVASNRELIGQRVDEVAASIGRKLETIDFDRIAEQAGRFSENAKHVASQAGALIEKFGGVETVLKRVFYAWGTLKALSIASMVLTVGGQAAALVTAIGSIAAASRAAKLAVDADMLGVENRVSQSRRLMNLGIGLGASSAAAAYGASQVENRTMARASDLEALGLSRENAIRKARDEQGDRFADSVSQVPGLRQLGQAFIRLQDAAGLDGNTSAADRARFGVPAQQELPRAVLSSQRIEIDLKVKSDDTIRVESGQIRQPNGRSGANLNVGVTMLEGN